MYWEARNCGGNGNELWRQVGLVEVGNLGEVDRVHWVAEALFEGWRVSLSVIRAVRMSLRENSVSGA